MIKYKVNVQIDGGAAFQHRRTFVIPAPNADLAEDEVSRILCREYRDKVCFFHFTETRRA